MRQIYNHNDLVIQTLNRWKGYSICENDDSILKIPTPQIDSINVCTPDQKVSNVLLGEIDKLFLKFTWKCKSWEEPRQLEKRATLKDLNY